MIDQQLAAYVPLRKLSKIYGMTIQPLSNHRSNHMSKSDFVGLRAAKAGINKNSPASALDRIEAGLKALEEFMTVAQKDRNTSQWIAGYKERLRTLEIVGKAKGEFSDAPIIAINLQQSAEWMAIRTVIMEVLEDHPHVRAALAQRLMLIEGSTT